MAETIRDFVISIGLNSKEATAAIDALEKKIVALGQKTPRRKPSENQQLKDQAKILEFQKNTRLKLIPIERKIQKLRDFKAAGGRVDERLLSKYEGKLNGIERSLGRIKNVGAFKDINRRLKGYNLSIDEAIRSQRGMTRSVKQTSMAVNMLALSIKNLARSYLSVFAIFGTAFSLNKQINEFSSIRASLLASSGTAEKAAEDFEFVKNTAMEMGLGMKEAAQGFQQIAVAGKVAGLSVSESENLFLSASKASVAFGLSAEDTQGVMRAFTQILSKGNVQAEELRGQLGDRLPIAMSLAAKSMSLTTDELDKLLKTGRVKSLEFIRAFSPALSEAAEAGGAFAEGLKTPAREQQRFVNSLKLLAVELGDSGVGGGLSVVWKTLADFIKSLTPTLVIVFKVLKLIMAPIVVLMKLVTGLFNILNKIGSSLGGLFGLEGAVSSSGTSSKGLQNSLSTNNKSIIIDNSVKVETGDVVGDPSTFEDTIRTDVSPYIARQSYLAEF